MMNKKVIWKIIHAAIIINFIAEIAYCTFQVMVVFDPGTAGPLFGAALDMDIDFFLKRRLYAIETWIAIGGLAIYLALTEIAPRWKIEIKAHDARNTASSSA